MEQPTHPLPSPFEVRGVLSDQKGDATLTGVASNKRNAQPNKLWMEITKNFLLQKTGEHGHYEGPVGMDVVTVANTAAQNITSVNTLVAGLDLASPHTADGAGKSTVASKKVSTESKKRGRPKQEQETENLPPAGKKEPKPRKPRASAKASTKSAAKAKVK
jgi:hypothetical protein